MKLYKDEQLEFSKKALKRLKFTKNQSRVCLQTARRQHTMIRCYQGICSAVFICWH